MATALLMLAAAVAAASAPAAGKPAASSDDARRALVRRARRVMLGVGWKHPFFLPAIARVKFVADDVPTACAERRGVIHLGVAYCAKVCPETPQGDARLAFLVCHELLHLMLCHWTRRVGRPFKKWNRATDRAINQVLKESGFAAPPDVLFPKPGQEAYTAEEHYTGEPDEDGDEGGGQGNDPGGEPGKGCGPVDDYSKGDEPDAPGDEPGAGGGAGGDREWKEITRQGQALDRTAGQGKGSALSRIAEVPPAKVKWQSVLRHALAQAIAEAGTDDVSWSRRSRRNLPGVPVLPGGVSTRARIAVAIDTSGSMSDADLARCIAETTAILRAAKVGAFLVVHDSAVQHALWLKPTAGAPEVAKRMTGRGGTSFAPAYARVAAEKGPRFSSLVHLTDGEVYGSWPARPANVRRLVAAIVGRPGSQVKGAPEGTRIVEVEV